MCATLMDHGPLLDQLLKVGQVGALNYAPSSMVYMDTPTCTYSEIRHIQPVVLSIFSLLLEKVPYQVKKKFFGACCQHYSAKSTFGESLEAHSMMHHVTP